MQGKTQMEVAEEVGMSQLTAGNGVFEGVRRGGQPHGQQGQQQHRRQQERCDASDGVHTIPPFLNFP